MAFNHRKSLTLKPNKNPNFATKFDAGSCYFCYICPDNCDLSPQPPPPPPPLSELSDPTKYHIPTVLILMLCILGLAFLILSYLTISRYRNSRRRNPSPETLTANFADENHGPMSDHPIWLIRTVGLPQSVIDSIASFEYQKSDGLINGNDCAVCLNDFRPKETLRLLPKCSHAFHLDCIDTWLRSHKNCPVCRAPIVREDGAIESNQTTSQSRQNGGEIERENDESRENRAIVIQSDDVARSDKLRVFSDLSDRTVRMESSDQHSPPASGRSVSVDLLYEIRDEGCSDQQK